MIEGADPFLTEGEEGVWNVENEGVMEVVVEVHESF